MSCALVTGVQTCALPICVTHDRYFLDNAAEWILELDRGYGIPWKGNYSSWLEQKDDRLKHEEASESARQRTIKKELEWVRQNPKGRQAKAKARSEEHTSELQSLMRISYAVFCLKKKTTNKIKT